MQQLYLILPETELGCSQTCCPAPFIPHPTSSPRSVGTVLLCNPQEQPLDSLSKSFAAYELQESLMMLDASWDEARGSSVPFHSQDAQGEISLLSAGLTGGREGGLWGGCSAVQEAAVL